MIVTIPTQQGMISFALNTSMLKLIATVAAVLMLLTGYVVMQLATFILVCTPQQFIRIVLFTAFLVGLFFVGRFVLSKAGAK